LERILKKHLTRIINDTLTGALPQASAGKFETNGKLINFMDGLTRQACKKPARCKAPERWVQGRETLLH